MTRPIRFKFIYTPEMENMPIANLDFGTRADNTLQRAGIITVGDFIEHWKDFGSYRNMGRKTVIAMKDIFFKWYLAEIEHKPDTWKRFINSIERCEGGIRA